MFLVINLVLVFQPLTVVNELFTSLKLEQENTMPSIIGLHLFLVPAGSFGEMNQFFLSRWLVRNTVTLWMTKHVILSSVMRKTLKRLVECAVNYNLFHEGSDFFC